MKSCYILNHNIELLIYSRRHTYWPQYSDLTETRYLMLESDVVHYQNASGRKRQQQRRLASLDFLWDGAKFGQFCTLFQMAHISLATRTLVC